MIRIGILGDIGSGKSYFANLFGYPVFNADKEVNKIYNSNKSVYIKLKKLFPKKISSFPTKKLDISKIVIENKDNIKKINKIVHLEVRLKLKNFLKKNKNKKFVILDIPLLLENKINNKRDVLIFLDAKKKNIDKKLKKRNNFNPKILKILKKLQLSLELKKKKSNFIVKNNFKRNSLKKDIKIILEQLKYVRNSA